MTKCDERINASQLVEESAPDADALHLVPRHHSHRRRAGPDDQPGGTSRGNRRRIRSARRGGLARATRCGCRSWRRRKARSCCSHSRTAAAPGASESR